MEEDTIQFIANSLHDAEERGQTHVQLTDIYGEIKVVEAYRIQEAIIALKQQQGHRLIGRKIGLTSEAKMKQVNVDEPIYGHLFDYMSLPSGSNMSKELLIHPRAEAEVAFIIGEDVVGPGVTGAHVLHATEYVLPAIEVIDSRYENFRFTLPDVIADNASSSRFVLGDKLVSPKGISLDLVGVTLWVNGRIRQMGAGATVMNHPANAVAMLANMLVERGEKLRAGEIVLAGAVTEAVPLKVGDHVIVKIDQLGDVHLHVT